MHGHELPRQASWDRHQSAALLTRLVLLLIGESWWYSDRDRLNPNKPRNTGAYSAQGEADGIIRPAEAVGAYRSQLMNSFSVKILRMDADSGDGVSGNPFYDPAPGATIRRTGSRAFCTSATLAGTSGRN